ncbi:MAG: SUMF1/EgtB/PvdO family nonheme iron enzyme [Phycisphaerae bacterium]|nr:SUMF1/EgtB/PvdO family nonheme iron enzyme [Saprospiraceae bacterium]
MIRIFIAYSSKDLVFKEEIRKRLRPLERAGKVSIWDNWDLEGGAEWDVEIREKLENADLILLLLSPDALDSDYFYEVEAPIALRRHEAGEAIAVGILLRPCMEMLKHTPLGDFTKYELLPKKGHPIVDQYWHHADEAYLTIFREVDILVEKIQDLRNGRMMFLQRQQEYADLTVQVTSLIQKKKWIEANTLLNASLTLWEEGFEPSREGLEKQREKCVNELKAKGEAARKKREKKERLQREEADHAAWEIAEETAKEAAYQKYIRDFSMGIHLEAALFALVEIEQTKEATAKEAVRPKNGQTMRDMPGGPEMVFVEGGNFQMGSDEDDSEKPIHRVSVPSFWMGKYPITFDEYDAFCSDNGKEKPKDQSWGRGRQPVINVYWEDAQEYCKWLSEKTGAQYHLPSEAEWEFAARGGTLSKGYKFAGGNNVDEVAWYWENSGEKKMSGEWNWDNIQKNNCKTHPVGEKRTNELGLHDMSGNVWEWCADAWHENYEGAPADGSAWMTGGEQERAVLRGGSWNLNDTLCRVAYRTRSNRTNRHFSGGFRVARAVGGE